MSTEAFRRLRSRTAVRSTSGALVSRFIDGSRPNVPDAVIKYAGSSTKTYRILSDQAGSPRLLVNVTDQTDRPFRASYDEFGAVSGTGLDFIPFGFAGGLFDQSTGLVRFGARDYDPSIGRWLSKDPLLFAGGQANLYNYVGNDPVNRRDTTGLYTEVIFWEPVGHAASSFGHVSIAINGNSYSWGPAGMDKESQASYVARNRKFRSGRGVVLGLDVQQEFALENYLKAYSGRYKALSNNCTDPIEHGLAEVGARDPNLDSLLPTGLARSLANVAIGQTAYVGPPRSASAPWSSGIRDSFQSMY
jgi:RHS repeat-associated protein